MSLLLPKLSNQLIRAASAHMRMYSIITWFFKIPWSAERCVQLPFKSDLLQITVLKQHFLFVVAAEERHNRKGDLGDLKSFLFTE